MSRSIANHDCRTVALEPAPTPAHGSLTARSLVSSAPVLALLALGCASESVDLGGGVAAQSLRRGARCENSTVLQGSVRVENQQELAALEGCEQIRGHLTVQLFAGADLAPLHALRAVEGGLLLGDSGVGGLSEEERVDSELVERIVAEEEPLRGTWLASLAGLESLERVGALGLLDSAIGDVSPLAGLRQIGGMSERESFLQPGALALLRNTALRDLTGFRQAQGVSVLDIFGNGALASLDGLRLGTELARVGIFEEPSLTDIDALASVTALGDLVLEGTALVDLDALSSLRRVDDGVSIMNNVSLLDASGLENLQQARSFNLENNASLNVSPSFRSYLSPPDSIAISGNPELEELSIDSPEASTIGIAVSGKAVQSSIDGIVIRGNAKLRSVVFPPSPFEPLGLSAIQILSIESNPSLTQIDFGEVARADVLAIDENPALVAVTLGALSTVDTLLITDNPAFDPSIFDLVRTFERVESGNAPPVAP